MVRQGWYSWSPAGGGGAVRAGSPSGGLIARWRGHIVNSAPFVTSTGPFLISTALADYGADNFTEKPKLPIKGGAVTKVGDLSHAAPGVHRADSPQKLVRVIATNKAAMRWPTGRPPRLGVLPYFLTRPLPGTAVASLCSRCN
eukprot:scaffold33969_cov47-Phaeocystis_antarctica.AAC.3